MNMIFREIQIEDVKFMITDFDALYLSYVADMLKIDADIPERVQFWVGEIREVVMNLELKERKKETLAVTQVSRLL